MTNLLTIDDLLVILQKRNSGVDLDLIRLAFEFADDAHHGQTRASGEPYIQHPLTAAITLAQLDMDEATLIAALLHDVPEDTPVTLNDIEKQFGKEVAVLVSGVTKLGKLKYRGLERYVENLRKMFVAMAEDVRVIFIRFADRLHNAATLSALPPEKAKRIALETIEIYAPIANRLGIGDIKGRLEDASFPYAYPEEFKKIIGLYEQKIAVRRPYVDELHQTLADHLRQAGLPDVSINGRLKHIYSLWRKLNRPENDGNIEKIYDLLALRVMVNSIAECYAVLGYVHQLWKPMPGRIKDYISAPKFNGYRSLHTTVFGPGNHIVEIQIRTHDMHREAEYGAAAHLRYKAQEDRTVNLHDSRYRWISQLLNWQREVKENPETFLEKLKIDFFEDRIFVLTPKGEVIDLPEGATPIDFAYTIHSDIGNSCVQAMVNEQIAPLDAPLNSGDVIKIVTDKKRKLPSIDWLDFVKTTNARQKIKTALTEAREYRTKLEN